MESGKQERRIELNQVDSFETGVLINDTMGRIG